MVDQSDRPSKRICDKLDRVLPVGIDRQRALKNAIVKQANRTFILLRLSAPAQLPTRSA